MSYLSRSLFVVVLAAVWTVPLKAQAPDFIKLGEIVQRCRQETGATNDDIQNIFMRKVPNTRSGQCMLACAGQGLGLMRDGNIDAEGTLAVAGRLLQGRDQRIMDAVKQAIMTCAQYSAANGSQDSCEAAARLANCGLDQAHRVNTRRTKDEQLLTKHASMRSAENGEAEGYFENTPSHSMKSLHSKTSSSYQRVRRQLPENSVQLVPGVTPVQTLPNQYSSYIPYTDPNQPLPLQTYTNYPVNQALVGQALNPYPYAAYQTGPYVQPVVVANPYVVPAVPLRRKRSPQEVVLTSTEIALPPEVAAQISERLRELLLALVSAQDDLVSNSTDVTEKDAEVIESGTRAPRKRRDTPSESKPESPFEPVFDMIRERVSKGPLHTLARGFQSLMNTTAAAAATAAPSPPTPASSPPAPAASR